MYYKKPIYGKSLVMVITMSSSHPLSSTLGIQPLYRPQTTGRSLPGSRLSHTSPAPIPVVCSRPTFASFTTTTTMASILSSVTNAAHAAATTLLSASQVQPGKSSGQTRSARHPSVGRRDAAIIQVPSSRRARQSRRTMRSSRSSSTALLARTSL